ncbi:MAG: hypothetical protein ACI31S_03905 [Bacilli bacterium]
MRKLNRKGYVTVEVLVSAVIAAAIAVFLIDLTVKLVNKTDDAYVDVTLTTDKALVIDNIKSNILYDINKYGVISDINCTTDKICNIRFANSNSYSEERLITITDDNIIKYCEADQEGSICFYTKKLDSSLSDINIKSSKSGSISDSDGDYVIFTITGKNIFFDNDYTINIPILNKYD